MRLILGNYNPNCLDVLHLQLPLRLVHTMLESNEYPLLAGWSRKLSDAVDMPGGMGKLVVQMSEESPPRS